MKTATKVFLIISLIMRFMFIVPLIIDIIALRKLEKETNPKNLVVIGVLVLIFSSLIAGILMLLMKPSDLEENRQK
ncbi:hypothetical protein [Metamycoplasma orale]|uniref:Uncharacterized protein n=2 Tax=Metamycoplasma orale TaxID=2121 RepID=A0A448ZX84_METOS|nr:hypothetical protein [Metamycoplasma orale]VEU55897.1 Uncharacterised protein [Metamycoplasma orale]